MNKKWIYAGLLAIAVLVGACANNNEEDLYPQNECDVTDVSFSVEVMPIIQSECATVGCHVQGGNGPGIFSTYEAVKAAVDFGTFPRRVITERNMPPTGSLTDCQIDHISQWLDNGAPNN